MTCLVSFVTINSTNVQDMSPPSKNKRMHLLIDYFTKINSLFYLNY